METISEADRVMMWYREWNSNHAASKVSVRRLVSLGRIWAELIDNPSPLPARTNTIESLSAELGHEPWYIRAALLLYDECQRCRREGKPDLIQRDLTMLAATVACDMRDEEGRLLPLYCPAKYAAFLRDVKGVAA